MGRPAAARVWKATRRCVLAALAVVASSGCYSFSNYQSARLLAPGEIAVIPSATRFQRTDGAAEADDGDWAVELQVRAGAGPRTEFGVKVSRILLEDGYQFVAFDAKTAVVPDRVAFSLPVGVFFGHDIDSRLQLHPTLIFGAPIDGHEAEVVFAAKALILFEETDTRTLPAFNLGVRWSRDLARWAVHPEIGLLIDPDDATSSFVQLGLGVWVKP